MCSIIQSTGADTESKTMYAQILAFVGFNICVCVCECVCVAPITLSF